MKTIRLNQILQYLEENNLKFSFNQKELAQENYLVASLFNPVNDGFYFFTGQKFELSIKNSLILTNTPLSSGNTELIVQVEDVQLLYYRILTEFFQPTSTGIISSMTEIHPEAKFGKNVQIDAFTCIGNSEIGDNVVIGSHVKIHDDVVIGANTIIESGSVIGTRGIAWAWNEDQTEKVLQPQLGGVKIGKGCVLSAQTILVRGSLNEDTRIGNYSYLAPGCRLGHGTIIGDYVHMANSIVTGGNTKIGDYSFIGSGAVFRPKVKVDVNTVVGAGSVVIKNTSKPGITLMGVPAKETKTKEQMSGMPKSKIKNI